MAEGIFLGQLIDFTAAGIPIVADLGMPFCLDGGLDIEIPGVQQIAFTADAIPITATAPHCCDSVDPCPRVETDLVDGGIEITIRAHAIENQNCVQARNQVVELTYCGPSSGGSGDCAYDACGASPNTECECPSENGKWSGDLELRGGTLHIEVCFSRETEFDPLIARLSLSGCGSACQDVEVECENPIIVHFDLISIPECCDCDEDQTTETGAIDLTVYGNCHPVILVQHIDFAADGTPIMGADNCEGGDVNQGLCLPHCGLVLAVTGAGDCACMDGEVDFPYVGTVEGASVWGEPTATGTCGPALYEMTCEPNLDEGGTPDGTVTLTLSVTCGATGTGGDSLVVDAEDLEDLDVTFEVTMTDPATGSCTGDCNYEWNEMAVTWSLVGDDCSEDCDDCPNSPDDPSPGGFDGDTRSQPCTGEVGVTCCNGTIEVRVTRP